MTSNRIRRTAAALLASILGLGLAAGCGEEESTRRPRRTVTIEQLPAEVLDAAKKRLTGVELTDAWQNLNPDGTFDSYEVRGRAANGKVREVKVSLTGEILEEE